MGRREASSSVSLEEEQRFGGSRVSHQPTSRIRRVLGRAGKVENWSGIREAQLREVKGSSPARTHAGTKRRVPTAGHDADDARCALQCLLGVLGSARDFKRHPGMRARPC